MDPNDPELRHGPKLYHELAAGRVPAGVDYILLQLPNRGQWYHESLAELARRLWNLDFNCSVIFQRENLKLLRCR
jgi:surfactin synthase thioesterase subunit